MAPGRAGRSSRSRSRRHGPARTDPARLASPTYLFWFLTGPLGVIYYTICLSLVITVLVNRTGGSVAMAILLHWSSNLIPYALREMFPDVHQAGPTYTGISRVALLAVTALVVGLAGRPFFHRPARPRPVVAS